MRISALTAIVLMTAGSGFAQKQAGAHGQGHAAAPAQVAAPQIAVRSGSGQRQINPFNPGLRPVPQRTDLPYQTGSIPQPGYSVGVTPGAYRNEGHSQRPFVGIAAVPYYPGYLGYSSDFSTFPGYAQSGYAQSGYPQSGYAEPAPPPATDNGGDALAQAQAAMADQIRQLSTQLADLKQSYPPVAQPAPVADSEPNPPVAAIRVVLRNGQQYSVKNFAVMNGELWDFSGSRVRKIPVSSIDIAASTKATEADGGQFPQLRPGS